MGNVKPACSDKSRHYTRGKRLELSDRQRLAILEIVKGATDGEAGKVCGVTRATVNDWRNNDPIFIRELNIQRNRLSQQAMKVFQKRMEEVKNAALDATLDAIRKGDTATARWFLERAGIGTFACKLFEQEASPLLFPEDLVAVLEELATFRVNEFLRKKGVNSLDWLQLQPGMKAKEIARLMEDYCKGVDAEE